MEFPTFLWLIILPLGASPLIYLSGHVRNRRISQGAALVVMLITWLPFAISAIQLQTTDKSCYTYGGISLCLDSLSLLLSAVALGLGTMVVIFSGPYMSKEANQEKFYAMLSAMVGVMIGLGCASDLFNLWIWFEAMAITSYLLVAFYRELPLSLEAGVKYLLQSAAGSVLVLLGISLVLALTGTMDLAEIRQAGTSPWLLAAGAAFLIGFGVKTALVPMHTWLPDAHSMAPSGISAMLSGVVIEAGLIAMLRSLGALAVQFLRTGSALEGTDEPLRVYHTCYRCLEKRKDPRSMQILQQAKTLLEAQVSKFSDETDRKRYVENIPWRRAIWYEEYSKAVDTSA